MEQEANPSVARKEIGLFPTKNEAWFKNFKTALETQAYWTASLALKHLQGEASKHCGADPVRFRGMVFQLAEEVVLSQERARISERTKAGLQRARRAREGLRKAEGERGSAEATTAPKKRIAVKEDCGEDEAQLVHRSERIGGWNLKGRLRT
jgi:hypothetical protein